MKLLYSSFFTFVALLLSGCFGNTDSQTHISRITAANDPSYAHDASYNNVKTKCRYNVLGFGYYSAPQSVIIANENKIKNIRRVESRVSSYVFFTKLCTDVYYK